MVLQCLENSLQDAVLSSKPIASKTTKCSTTGIFPLFTMETLDQSRILNMAILDPLTINQSAN